VKTKDAPNNRKHIKEKINEVKVSFLIPITIKIKRKAAEKVA